MASPAEIQAQLDSGALGTVATILSSVHADSTYDNHYVVGIRDNYCGRALWVTTTASESAADQATAINAALRLFR